MDRRTLLAKDYSSKIGPAAGRLMDKIESGEIVRFAGAVEFRV